MATALLHAVGKNTKLSARREEGMGRGVFTSSPVFPGTTVARSELVIDTAWARASAYCQDIDGMDGMDGMEGMDGMDGMNGEDPYAVLCVFLYRFLYCSSRKVRDAESTALSCYREVLLADASISVLDWAENDVDMLLGSHLHTMARDMRRTGEATIGVVDGILGGNNDLTALRRCLSILLTRLVRLDDGSVALAPGLDLLNHASSSRSYIAGTRAGVRVVNRDGVLSKESQVLVNYGAKTSGELFISYGFLPAENPHDGVLVPLEGGETVVLGFDGGVRLMGSGRGVDRGNVRAELKRAVRRQLEAMEVHGCGRMDGSDDAFREQVRGVISSERKVLSRALMAL